MSKHFFRFVEKLGKNLFPNYNFLWRNAKRLYYRIKIIADPNIVKPDKNAIAFFTENSERINAIANMLADEQSKREYLGMVKFRQTRCKKDYPKFKYEPEYFFDKLKLAQDEVFIDCGAYIGDTVDEFLKRCPEYKQIAAFEPDSKIFEKLKAKHGNNPKITLIKAGVYDKESEVLFEEHDGYSRINNELNEQNVTIQVKTIDNLNLEKVSFIKMDVEGAELNALKGAEKTIIRDKPKLAICIYHSNEDMIHIAEYIHNLRLEYKLYVRQYSFYPLALDTILYALP